MTTPATVREHASSTFGAFEAAQRWLERPTTALAGARPLDLLSDEVGRQQILALLIRVDHGVAA